MGCIWKRKYLLLLLFVSVSVFLFVTSIKCYSDNQNNLVDKISSIHTQQLIDKKTHYTGIDIDMIHVVLSVDIKLLNGIIALIESIIQHNSHNEIIIHIVITGQDKLIIENAIKCTINISENIQMQYVNFEIPTSFEKLINVKRDVYLASAANFARFFFDKLFQNLSHVLYLDSDIIVLHDLRSIWDAIITMNDKLILVVPREYRRYYSHFTNPNLTILYKKRYNKAINMSSVTFNAGVIGFNLDKWRTSNSTYEVIYWMEEHNKNPLWFQGGSQPFLYIIGFNNWKTIDERWNVEGLGWKKVPRYKVKSAYILHWNGPYKPWDKLLSKDGHLQPLSILRRYNSIWNKYNKHECNNNGVCQTQNGNCICNHGYGGHMCTIHQ